MEILLNLAQALIWARKDEVIRFSFVKVTAVSRLSRAQEYFFKSGTNVHLDPECGQITSRGQKAKSHIN